MAGDKGEAQKKFAKVMREFHEGKLKDPSGEKITSEGRAQAVAFKEARKISPKFRRS